MNLGAPASRRHGRNLPARRQRSQGSVPGFKARMFRGIVSRNLTPKAALKTHALQTLPRIPDALLRREAFGVRASLAPLFRRRSPKVRFRGLMREPLREILSPFEAERENYFVGSVLRGKSDRKRLEQFVNFPVAVGKRVEMDADFVEQRQVEIGQGGRLGILDVTSTLHSN